MWFKKKSVLQAEGNYNSNTAVDGTDWRTNGNSSSWSVSSTLPSAADANKYFYLPALGDYIADYLEGVGTTGFYWSSSAYPLWGPLAAYRLSFQKDELYLSHALRDYCGFRVEPTFE